MLKQFERLSSAPGGVARLRQLILELAVRGSLVRQDSSDEPATEVLGRIKSERERVFKKERWKKRKPLPPISAIDLPFVIPDAWVWTRLDEACIYDCGRKHDPKEIETGAWILDLEDIEKSTGEVSAKATAAERIPTSTKAAFASGDVLYGKLRPYLNKCVVASEPGFCTTEIIVIRLLCGTDPDYISLALRTPYFVDYVTRMGKGAKMPRLRTDDGRSAMLPLPPLAEQKRIVAKVKELMGLCDELEAAQAERERQRDRLNASSLHRIASAPDDPALRVAAKFHLQILPRVTVRPDQIPPLRQSILDLAVRGKLVAQDGGDVNALSLLELIAADRDQHCEVANARLPKPVPAVEVAEVLWNPPPGWKWVRIGSILREESQNGFSKKPDNNREGIQILRISAATGRDCGTVDETDFKWVTADEAIQAKFSLQTGDILACRFNGNLSYTGQLAVYRGQSGAPQIYPDKLIRLRLSPEFLICDFVRIAVNSHPIREVLEAYCATTVGNIGISATNLKLVVLPLPPLAEQRRIVAKVDELMALCDELEASLTRTQTESRRLLDAVMAEITAA